MKLTVLNGSPRGKASNTTTLLSHFLRGFNKTKGNRYEELYLIRERKLSTCVEAFQDAEAVILAFPLYVDCMPAVVKYFIEALEPLCGSADNPRLGFIIQSGFPESVHSHYLRRYLEKLCRRLGSPYLGTVIKGGAEGIKDQPAWMHRKLFRRFFELGRIFGRTGELDKELVTRLGRPVRFSGLGLIGARLGGKMGEMFYWNKMLKNNGAYEQRFDRPYVSKPEE